jgi:hypothetical protein
MTLNQTLLSITLTGMLFSSCVEKSYLHSPMQGTTLAYHAMPLASDAIKSATYVNGALSAGGMNVAWRDAVYAVQAGLHRSHAVDNFRFNYGASIAAGSYHVKPFYNYYNNNTGGVINYSDGGAKSFGAYGVYGGVSAATRMGHRGEWRYIGVEGSLFNEFGQYYSFRKNLPDSAATEIDKKKYLGSLGINTELVFKGRSQNKFGIKIAMGSYLRHLHYNEPYPASVYHPYDDLIYFSNTYHFTFKRTTTYFQFNIATHAGHFQVGYNYSF